MVLSITVKRPFVLYTAVLAFVLLLAYNSKPILQRASFLSKDHSGEIMTSWSSKYSGWHTRATPSISPESFTPTREGLAFASLYHAPANPDGFSVAFFHPNIAVDARGVVLVVNQDDFAGLEKLAKQSLELPQTGLPMNTWRINQRRTDQPIHRLHVPRSSDEIVETGVQGFEKGKKSLKEPVDGINELPEVLHEIIGLVVEGREGYERGKANEEVIGKVKAVLDGV